MCVCIRVSVYVYVRRTWSSVIGPHGPSDCNENGEHLLDLCACNSLIVTNTWFQHKRIGKICSNFVQFNLGHYTLTQTLMKQGYWYSGLCMAFRKFARSHVGIITKI